MTRNMPARSDEHIIRIIYTHGHIVATHVGAHARGRSSENKQAVRQADSAHRRSLRYDAAVAREEERAATEQRQESARAWWADVIAHREARFARSGRSSTPQERL